MFIDLFAIKSVCAQSAIRHLYIIYVYKLKRRDINIVKKFQNKRFITKGVAENIEPILQLFMWQCIEEMPLSKDYLQVFDLVIESGKAKVKHSQEEPDYEKEYLLNVDTLFYVGKIFVIDDGTHSTMLLANEY